MSTMLGALQRAQASTMESGGNHQGQGQQARKRQRSSAVAAGAAVARASLVVLAPQGAGGHALVDALRPALRAALNAARVAVGEEEEKGGEEEAVVEVEARLGLVGTHEQRAFATGTAARESDEEEEAVWLQKDQGGRIATTPLAGGQALGFETGVSRTHFHVLQERLQREGFVVAGREKEEAAVWDAAATARHPTLASIVTGGTGASLRRSRDLDSGRDWFEIKRRATSENVALFHTAYDVRISTSTERPLRALPVDELQRYVGELPVPTVRHKTRVSLVHKENPWRVDLTEVKQEQQPTHGGVGGGGGRGARRGASHRTVFEVEAELDPAWATACLEEERGAQENDHLPYMAHVAASLDALVRLVNPREQPDTLDTGAAAEAFSTVGHAQRNAAISQCARVRNLLASGEDTTRGATADARGFPGAMPCAFTRRGLQEVLNAGDYFVTEKTDGERRLLIALTDTCVLVDRAFSMTTFPGAQQLVNAPIPVGSVLDGELVVNREDGQPVFLIFDVLSWGEPSAAASSARMDTTVHIVGHRPFAERHSLLQETILPALVAATSATSPPGQPALLRLGGKTFFPTHAIADLLSCVAELGQDRVFRDAAHPTLRHHKTDGIIFQPNLPYQPKRDPRLLKWKYPDTVTIDLLASLDPATNRISLSCFGPQEVDVDVTDLAELHEQDRRRLLADITLRPNPHSPAVAEVAYDASHGAFSYKMLRSDKTTSNYVGVVMQTLAEMAEDIELNELFTRMRETAP